jgi:hypothetical protein
MTTTDTRSEAHNLDATVFVYRHRATGNIEARYIDGALGLQTDPDYEHLATLEPRLWIQAHYADSERDEALLRQALLRQALGALEARTSEEYSMAEAMDRQGDAIAALQEHGRNV